MFSQSEDARLATQALTQNALRFFAAKLGLTVDKSYTNPLSIDAARFVLKTDDPTTTGTRLCYGRPALPEDLRVAEEAERAQQTFGLANLAARCPVVWLVVPEIDDDRTALTLAAIFASVMLGPIVPPGATEIFGVRTARMKLERVAQPYR